MRRLLVFFVLALASSAAAQPKLYASAEEERLVEQWSDTPLLPAWLPRAMLLAEGVADSSALARHEAVVEEALATVSRHVKERHSNGKKAKAIFKRLHQDVLHRYDEDAQLSDLADGGRFNCVTGTALFFLAAQRHGVPVDLHVTPVHVYAVADPDGEALRIEITDPKKGFDFDDERDDVIEHLLAYKMITPEELEYEGEDAIYRAFVEDEWEIEPEALVGIVYNNEAVSAIVEERYEEAVASYEKALAVEPEREEYRQSLAGALALAAIQHGDEPDRILLLLRRAFERSPNAQAFSSEVLPVVAGVALQLAQKQRYEALVELLQFVAQHAAPGSDEASALERMEAGANHDWAMSMMRRGDYEGGWEKSSRAYELAPEEPLYREGIALTTCRYAHYLAERRETESGLELVGALTEWRETYPIIGETYAELTVYHISSGSDALINTDLAAAKATVLRAMETVPDEPRLRDALSMIYHEEAMAEVRADNYDAAEALAEEGLRLDPESRPLREALELIRKAQ